MKLEASKVFSRVRWICFPLVAGSSATTMSTPTNNFPGAWPESARPSFDSHSSTGDNIQALPPGLLDGGMTGTRSSLTENSSRGLFARSPQATNINNKSQPPPLRILVPPSAYCPFSTDLSIPISPLTLHSSFMSDTSPDPPGTGASSASIPPTPGLVSASSSSPISAGPIVFASPTSSHFPPMPPTPESADTSDGAAVNLSPLGSSPAEPNLRLPALEADQTKEDALKQWETTGATWLADLGGDNERDRIFRRNLYETCGSTTDSSPGSTPALSLSPAISLSPIQMPSLAFSLSSTPASPSSSQLSPSATSSHVCVSSRLALQPTSTAAFPSSVDNFEHWREDADGRLAQAEGADSARVPAAITPINSPSTTHSSDPNETLDANETLQFPDAPPRLPGFISKNFVQRAREFGERVKRLVVRRSTRSQMHVGRGGNGNVSCAHDSGSVILIIAPPPPYEDRSHTPTPPSPEDPSNYAGCQRRPSIASARSLSAVGGRASPGRGQQNGLERTGSTGRNKKSASGTKANRRFSLTVFPGFSTFRK
ncbi:hypothetical protein BV22DRAFT_26758 [Leucogyrophana mollusca]|uniref:Uncharacterized protein n=1 Tax=Leucogyrophana mollusca TaxID=85980 RepID=A0ACB8C024_9AGAM|nr:hypothetical protein BV22DRAFT_26758 [Leucogyrophana mollusca]